MAKKKLTKDSAIEQLWRLGELKWKLKGKQKDIYDHFKNSSDGITACLIGRQFGKSHTLLVLANECCVKNPGTIIKYACPEQRMVERILKPRMKKIIEDCPEDLKPEWKTQEKIWLYPNGSEIQISGCNAGHYDALRGGTSHICIVDESAFIDSLEEVVFSVLAPTTDTTNGVIWLASTPNDKDPTHDFHEFFVFPLQAQNKLLKFTLYDSPMLTPEKINKIINRYPGKDANPKFRCEYLCEIPKSSESTVVPEFTLVKNEIVFEDIVVPYCRDYYVGMDVGFRDLTVVLFGYYDFTNAKLIILDELVMNGPEMTTESLAREIKHKEELRFFDKEMEELIKPYLRISDNDLKLLNDLNRLHDLQFMATAKDNREAAINMLRLWVSNKRIQIHSRCKHLIYHLENAQWDKNRDKFRQLKDSPNGEVRGGHADALAACYYLVRNINEFKNPYPHDFGQLKGSNVWKSKNNPFDKVTEAMHQIFNIKKK